ncbi:MAG: MinD/ParA family protein [Methylocystaceae bacterium]
MKDQADKLRDMARNIKQQIESDLMKNRPRTRVVVVTSGKGGVGKTNFALNLSIAMARMGQKVILMDADMGLANVDIILGIVPEFNLYHVVRGEKKIREVMEKGPAGIRIIPGGSGVQEMANLPDKDLQWVINDLSTIDGEADLLIIDTGAGIANNVISFLAAADDIIVVTTPEPTALADAYGLIKTASHHGVGSNVYAVINKCANSDEGRVAFEKLQMVATRFLDMEIKLIGLISEDELVEKAVRRQEAFINYPESRAAGDIYAIARHMLQINDNTRSQPSGIRGFFKALTTLWR